MAASIGSYYITIMPDMSKFTGNIVSNLSSAGTSGAQSFSDSFVERVKSSAIGVAIGNAISSAIQKVMDGLDTGIERVDIINNFPKVMQNLGFAADDAAVQVDRIQDSLMGLPTSLQDGVQAVQRLVASTGDLEGATDLFIAFNNALVSGGAPTNLQSSALEQFLQIVAKGKPDMLEWRSLLNAMPAQMSQIAQSMGMTVGELGEAMRDKDGGYAVTQEFLEAIIKLNEEGVGEYASFADQVGTVTKTIGTAQTNLSNRIGAAWAEILNAIGQEVIFERIDSFSKRILELGKSIGAFIKELKASEVFQKFMEALQVACDWFIQNSGTILPILTGLIAGIKGFQVINDAVKWFDNLKKAATALFTTLTTNPIALIIAAIVALVAAFAVWVNTTEEGKQTWETIVSAVSTGIDAIVQWFSAAWETICTVAQAVADFFVGVWDGIVSVAGTVADYFVGVWDTITGAVSTGIDFIVGCFNAFMDAISPITDALGHLWNSLVGLFDALSPYIEGVGVQVSNFMSMIGTAVKAIGDYFTEMFNVAAPFVSWLVDTVIGTIWTQIQGFANMLAEVFSWLFGRISEIIDFLSPILSFIVDSVIGYLSKSIPEFGNMIVNVIAWLIDSIANVVDVVTAVINTITSILSKVVTTVSNIFNKIKSTITTVVNNIKNTVKNVFESIGKFMSDPIGNAVNAIGEAINNIKNWFSDLIGSIKMPHLTVTGSLNPLDWFSQGLPNISIAWYKAGGMFDGATLYGLGEAGTELAWPSYEPYLSKYGKAIADHMDGGGETTVYNIYIDGTKVNAQGVIDVVDDLITQASRYAGMNLGGERKYAY